MLGGVTAGGGSCKGPIVKKCYHQVANSLIDIDCMLEIILFSEFWTLG